MTNKEAIELLQTPIHCADKGDEEDMREALSMAIKALENHDTFMKYSYEQGKKDALSQQPTDRIEYGTDGNAYKLWISNGKEFEQEPCDDKRLFIKIYADYEPSVVAEKVYQICDEDEFPEVVSRLNAYLEPCDDAISREDAIESIANIDETDGTVAIFTGKQVIALLKDLPSVNAIQHTNTLGDAVSREAVLDAIKRISLGQTDVVKVSMTTEDYVEKLPSVTQKSGKWINDKNDIPICSRCGYMPQYDRAIDDYEYSNYCPNCGARMESEK